MPILADPAEEDRFYESTVPLVGLGQRCTRTMNHLCRFLEL